MASDPKLGEGITLEEFLRMPDIEEAPAMEYIDGRIEAKAIPQMKHSVIQVRMLERLNAFARPAGLGEAVPELRCTYEGRSIVPDVVFLIDEHIPVDENGEYLNETFRPPDIHVEIISPDQSVTQANRKLLHSTSHGCPLGVMIHPERKTIDVYRPGRPPERLAADGILEGEPVLPGFRLPAAEVFGWLVRRRPQGPGAGPG